MMTPKTPSVATLDSCVLYSAPVRDLLLRLAEDELFAPRWTERILLELTNALAGRRPALPAAGIERLRQAILTAFPGALVRGFEPLEANLNLPDPGDNHVLAAAIHAQADVIVTFNVRHFPAERTGPWGIKVLEPDAFVLDLVEAAPQIVCDSVRRQAQDLSRPPVGLDGLLTNLALRGLSRSVERLRPLLESGLDAGRAP